MWLFLRIAYDEYPKRGPAFTVHALIGRPTYFTKASSTIGTRIVTLLDPLAAELQAPQN